MFERFESGYRQDAPLARSPVDNPIERLSDQGLGEPLSRFSGVSFNSGLYRVMATGTLRLSNTFIAHTFPGFANRITSFSYDWLGRIFALDSARLVAGSPAVVMFEPGTGQVLEIPCNLITFHENELVDHGEEALAAGFHKQWIAGGGAAPKLNQCVGYKKPLFLGGKDVIENLEISDLDVYWTLSAQLIQKARGLSPGTRVARVGLSG